MKRRGEEWVVVVRSKCVCMCVGWGGSEGRAVEEGETMKRGGEEMESRMREKK